TPELQAQIAAIPGVQRIEFLREQQLLLDPSLPRVVLQARPLEGGRIGTRLPLEGSEVLPAPGAPPPIWVNGAMSDVYGFTPGRVVSLPIAGRSLPFTGGGAVRDYARQQGAIVIERERYIALGGDPNATNGAIWLAAGIDGGTVRN